LGINKRQAPRSLTFCLSKESPDAYSTHLNAVLSLSLLFLCV
jgi:hypothetical protein